MSGRCELWMDLGAGGAAISAARCTVRPRYQSSGVLSYVYDRSSAPIPSLRMQSSGALSMSGRCELRVGEIAFVAATHAASTLTSDVQYGCDALYPRRRTAARFAARMRTAARFAARMRTLVHCVAKHTTNTLTSDVQYGCDSPRDSAARVITSVASAARIRTLVHNITHGRASVCTGSARMRAAACNGNACRRTAVHSLVANSTQIMCARRRTAARFAAGMPTAARFAARMRTAVHCVAKHTTNTLTSDVQYGCDSPRDSAARVVTSVASAARIRTLVHNITHGRASVCTGSTRMRAAACNGNACRRTAVHSLVANSTQIMCARRRTAAACVP